MRIFGRQIPLPRLLTALAVFVGGSLLGVGIFTFTFAKGYAYLGNDPATCAQCHIMEDWYEGWQRGSHANVATCNDCHAPHGNPIEKYAVKGVLGFGHALAFTTGWHPENLQAGRLSTGVIEDSCLYCHGDFVQEIGMGRTNDERVSCISCHDDVGHM